MQPFSSTLISTKTTRPVLHTRLVHRIRLIDRLRAGMNHRLTCLVAPAGFGKTTLLSEWLASPAAAGWSVAWFSLDEEDNNPIRFWDYFVASLEQIHPQIKDFLAGIKWQESELREIPFITSLVNAINTIDGSFGLVLDDYHLIENEAIHDGLSMLLRYLPANMHIIIASRTEPPLSISRLRAQNEVVEVRFDDLKFTIAETNTFLTQIMGLKLPPYQVSRLAYLTEGWIAGLVLAVPALQHLSTPYEIDNFIAHFGGNYKHIFNFLTVEVLNHLTPKQKEFLLKTSILPELNAQLCDAVLAISNSRAILDELEGLNLFLYPLNEQRQWFHCHNLFASSLQLHLTQTYPKTEIEHLHQLACEWHRARGDMTRAIPHALLSGQDDLAAKILEEFLSDECNQSSLEISTLDWYKHIPTRILDRYPDLRMQWAMLCLVHGYFDQVEVLLKQIELSLSHQNNSQINAKLLQKRILALRTAIQCVTGDYRQSIQQARQVLKTMEEIDSPKILLEYYLALAHQAGDDQTFDVEDWKVTIHNHYVRKDSNNYLFSQALLAFIYEQRGQLFMAAEVYQDAREYIQSHNLEELLLSLVIQMGLSDIYREWNDQKLAEDLASNAKELFLAYQTGEPCWFHSTKTCLLLAKNSISFGNLDDAGEYIDIASQRAQASSAIPSLKTLVDEVRVTYWLASGKMNMASAWARTKEDLYANQPLKVDPIYRLLIAQVALAEKRFDQVLSWLEDLFPVLADANRGRLLLKARTLKALAHWEMGQRQEARLIMHAILPEAARENVVRSFIELHPQMESLLRATAQEWDAATSQSSPDMPTSLYFQRLIAAFHPEDSTKLQTLHSSKVIDLSFEKLTEREMEILTLLASGLSTGRMAAKLTISTSTVKTHIHNIYQKLGTNTRERAIDRAHDLGLI